MSRARSTSPFLSTTPQQAADAFGRSLRHCHNLIAIHEERNDGQGRRHREISLNRAVIVLAVATWQTLVQDIAVAALNASKPASSASGADKGTYRLIRGQIERHVTNFSTPNTAKTRELLEMVGVDVKPFWTWEVTVQGSGTRQRSFDEVSRELEDWLSVRHAIAHGHREIPRRMSLDAIATQYASDKKNRAVSESVIKSYRAPEVRKADALRCTRFINDIGESTAEALAAVLGEPTPTWPAWPESR